MSEDPMEIDSDHGDNVPPLRSPEKKRKHKHREHSPSKKRKHASAAEESKVDLVHATPDSPKKSKRSSDTDHKKRKHVVEKSEQSDPNSPFRLVTATMYLPLSPISISPTHALASLLAEHLSPLLLTYYPPFKGIVMAYSNASISSEALAPEQRGENPQPLTLATTAPEYGVLYVYLTATFLVFRPQKGQVLEGWVNVQSDGFLGAVVYNLFSVGIERKRLPPSWKWVPPGADDEESGSDALRKTKSKKTGFSTATSGEEDEASKPDFNPEREFFAPFPRTVMRNPIDSYELFEDEQEDADASATGYFQSVSGHRVRGTVRFRVRDVDVIPGADPDRGFMSIEGTMLSPEEEARLVDEDRTGAFPAGRRVDPTAMTGGLMSASNNQQNSAADATSVVGEDGPGTDETGAKTKKEEKKKKKKSKDKSKSGSKSKEK
jgi:DNA-directed RNA polymerase I subunit RPA43